MKIADRTSNDVHTDGGSEAPPCIGLTPSALPEAQSSIAAANSQTGVSTKSAQPRTDDSPAKATKPVQANLTNKGETANATSQSPKDTPHWYALRATYGREKKAYDYLIRNHVEAYYPTIKTIKEVNGKIKAAEESRLPNIFFARGTEDEIKTHVYDNINLPHLRFYYRQLHKGSHIVKEPLIVPDYQMESLKIICAAEEQDIIISSVAIPKFEKGQMVRITKGPFKGVVGRVARYHGQQRVAIDVNGIVTVCTAYVPTAYLEKNL